MTRVEDIEFVKLGWRAPSWAYELAAGTNTLLARCRALTELVVSQQEKLMAKVDDVLAAITANTDLVRSMQQAIDALREGQASIADEIAALKAATPAETDFSAVDAALADQKTLLESASSAIGANTSGPAQ